MYNICKENLRIDHCFITIHYIQCMVNPYSFYVKCIYYYENFFEYLNHFGVTELISEIRGFKERDMFFRFHFRITSFYFVKITPSALLYCRSPYRVYSSRCTYMSSWFALSNSAVQLQKCLNISQVQLLRSQLFPSCDMTSLYSGQTSPVESGVQNDAGADELTWVFIRNRHLDKWRSSGGASSWVGSFAVTY